MDTRRPLYKGSGEARPTTDLIALGRDPVRSMRETLNHQAVALRQLSGYPASAEIGQPGRWVSMTCSETDP